MRKLPKPLVLCLFLLSTIAAPLMAASSPQPSASTSSISANTVNLEFSSASVTVKERVRKEGIFSAFETSLPLIGQPSEPALPIVTQMVGVPSRLAPQATITLADAQSLPSLKHPLEPMPSYERQQTDAWRNALEGSDGLNSEAFEPRYVPNERLYTRNEWYPPNPVEISEPMTLRGQVVVEVSFTPVQVNLATGEARWFSSADVTLDWANQELMPNMAFVEDPNYESFLESMLSNYEQARAWRFKRSSASERTRQAQPAGSNSWIITLQGQGLFRIRFTQLQAAGVDTSNSERLALYYGSGDSQQEQAIWIDNDSLYFVNTRDHNRWSKNIAYRLELLSEGTGQRMEELSSPPDQATTVDSVPYELHFEKDTLYESLGAVAGANDRWYWEKFLILPPVFTKNSFNESFDLPDLVASHTTPATMTVELAPLESGCHHARILINATSRAEKGSGCSWSGMSAFDEVISVPHSELMPTSNEFTIEQEVQQGKDTLMFNSLNVRYQRSLVTTQEGLFFDSDRSSGVNFKLNGLTQLFLPVVIGSGSPSDFSRSGPPNTTKVVTTSQANRQNTPSFLAFEVSVLNEPKRITGGTTNNSSFSFGRGKPSDERYLVLQSDQTSFIESITSYTDSGLRNSSNQADYLIITHPDFESALQPLVDHRKTQCGPNREACTVRLVTTTQIYNEFGASVIDHQAIRDFIQYAYQNWSAPAPAYVLFVGDATYDPFDHTGGGKKVWLPPWMVDVDPWLGEVPGDHGYVVALDANDSPDANPLADMHSGRLPVNSAEEASGVVQKIINYETNATTGDWRHNILLTTDDEPDNAGPFYALSDSSAQRFTDNIQVTRAYYGQSGYENDTDVRNKIVEKMNEGVVITQYIGHSSRTQWARPAIWTTSRSDGSNDLDLLTANERLPLSVPWTCLEGYFILPDKDSLAEEMLGMSDRGIIASFSPTGLDVATGHDILTQRFYRGIFEEGQIQLGPLTEYSKTDIVNTQYERMLYTYMFLGDPALYLNIDLPQD